MHYIYSILKFVLFYVVQTLLFYKNTPWKTVDFMYASKINFKEKTRKEIDDRRAYFVVSTLWQSQHLGSLYVRTGLQQGSYRHSKKAEATDWGLWACPYPFNQHSSLPFILYIQKMWPRDQDRKSCQYENISVPATLKAL